MIAMELDSETTFISHLNVEAALRRLRSAHQAQCGIASAATKVPRE